MSRQQPPQLPLRKGVTVVAQRQPPALTPQGGQEEHKAGPQKRKPEAPVAIERRECALHAVHRPSDPLLL